MSAEWIAGKLEKMGKWLSDNTTDDEVDTKWDIGLLAGNVVMGVTGIASAAAAGLEAAAAGGGIGLQALSGGLMGCTGVLIGLPLAIIVGPLCDAGASALGDLLKDAANGLRGVSSRVEKQREEGSGLKEVEYKGLKPY